ncbi:hypothetical protein [Pediococcus stilesii]|uniref:hypothetical protein n=1 Tax=Pediococcus stilesii TaxID=331679 RepID=UPI0014864801|nr:hypothetical protein [Pediococcus stilesii]
MQKDINNRVNYEKDQQPKIIKKKKKTAAEKAIGIMMFIILLGNLIFMFSNMFMHK